MKKNTTDRKGFSAVEISVASLLLAVILVTVFSMFGSLRSSDSLGKRVDVNEEARMFLFRISQELIAAKRIIEPKSWWDGSYPVKSISFLDNSFLQINYRIEDNILYRWEGTDLFSNAGVKKRKILENIDSKNFNSYFHFKGRQEMVISIKLSREKNRAHEKIQHMRLETIVFLRGLMEYQ